MALSASTAPGDEQGRKARKSRGSGYLYRDPKRPERVRGPFSARELIALARGGEVRPRHEVSADGNRWVPATKVRPPLFAEAAEEGKPRATTPKESPPPADGDRVVVVDPAGQARVVAGHQVTDSTASETADTDASASAPSADAAALGPPRPSHRHRLQLGRAIARACGSLAASVARVWTLLFATATRGWTLLSATAVRSRAGLSASSALGWRFASAAAIGSGRLTATTAVRFGGLASATMVGATQGFRRLLGPVAAGWRTQCDVLSWNAAHLTVEESRRFARTVLVLGCVVQCLVFLWLVPEIGKTQGVTGLLLTPVSSGLHLAAAAWLCTLFGGAFPWAQAFRRELSYTGIGMTATGLFELADRALEVGTLLAIPLGVAFFGYVECVLFTRYVGQFGRIAAEKRTAYAVVGSLALFGTAVAFMLLLGTFAASLGLSFHDNGT